MNKQAVIKKENGEYVLYTADGSRVLGRHKNRKDAIKQEYAIQKSKEKRAGMYCMVKMAYTSPVLSSLLDAKSYSDQRNYGKKAQIMRRLMRRYPNDFTIDSSEKGIYGVTHTPTGFRLHLPASVVSGLELGHHSI